MVTMGATRRWRMRRGGRGEGEGSETLRFAVHTMPDVHAITTPRYRKGGEGGGRRRSKGKEIVAEVAEGRTFLLNQCEELVAGIIVRGITRAGRLQCGGQLTLLCCPALPLPGEPGSRFSYWRLDVRQCRGGRQCIAAAGADVGTGGSAAQQR